MMKRYALFLLIALSVWCCKKGTTTIDGEEVKPVVKPDSAGITSAVLLAKSNTGKITTDVTCTITGDEITALIPDRLTSKKLTLTFTTRTANTTVKVGDTTQVSGVTVTDYTKPVTLNVTSATGLTKAYTVKFKIFTGLPILYITSASAITSKDTYVKGSVIIDANQGYTQEVNSMTMQIKGHGNSTWVLPEFKKKPYKIKFDSKIAMLGMSAAKNWILLANYTDKTLMRNYLALQLAKRLGADYTPDCRFVEVVLNGGFVGNYLLTTAVEVNSNRVNITELTDKNTADSEITGGYLVELDQKLDGASWFKTTKNLPFVVKSPDAPTAKQLDYIHNYFQATEDALFSADFKDPDKGYAKYLNPDSFITWYFTNEIFENDARDFSSIFYYKDRGGKLNMGPVWDFDLSAGNINYTPAQNPTGIWYIRDATWMIRLAQDPTYDLKVRAKWAQIRDKEVKQIFTDIDQTAAYLKLSQQANFTKWPILDQYVWPNVVWLGTYDKEVAYMKDFLQQRINWMDANMSSW